MRSSLAPREPQQTIHAFQRFFDTPLDRILDRHRHEDPEAHVVSLFHVAAASVPAYRAFLADRGIDRHAVRTFADFQALPLTTKQNYLAVHPLASLCRDGRLDGCDMIAVSSGSTGKPGFWPRSVTDELGIAVRFEQVFHDSFEADKASTLAIVCFALGTWVGGMFTSACCRHLAAKGYPITVVTPGNNKEEILRIFADLAPCFEQTVLLGYPPFLKDVVDSGIARGVKWGERRIRIVTAGEVFSEEWRSLMAERTGATDLLTYAASLYGTADAGVLGNETPLSVAIRRFLAEAPRAARELFGQERLPTLVQYDPFSRFFEVDGNTLLFSGDNGVPLVRYHISDEGGLYPYDTLLGHLAGWGFSPEKALGTDSRGQRPLPFVYVFGRSHFTISYFGANVYPENVTVGLEQPGIREWVTGKFVMEVRETTEKNPYLSVVVELAPEAVADEEKARAVAEAILGQLLRLNSEFAAYTPLEYRLPRVTLAPSGDPEYFPVGVKHRYTRK